MARNIRLRGEQPSLRKTFQDSRKKKRVGIAQMSESRNVETAKHHRISLPEVLKLANIKVGFGIGDVEVAAFDEAGILFQGDYENEKPLRFRLLEDEGQIVVGDWSSVDWLPYFWYFFGDCRIKLNKHVPLRIAVDSRVGDTYLDLFELRLQDLRVRYLVGDLDVQFPQVGLVSGSIESTLGDITIAVPRALGARIRLGSAVLGKCRIEGDLFERHRSEYVSKDFDKAENRLDLRIEFHLGDLRITSI